MSEKNPNDQYQIGDHVVYLPEGVIAVVEGYLWYESIGVAPQIIKYRLSCGIAVPGTMIARRATAENISKRPLTPELFDVMLGG